MLIDRFTPRLILHAVLAAAFVLCLALCSCEYPEEGYYQLDVFDEDGEVFGIFPFYVKELVDDTSLTYGFVLQVPQAGLGRIVEVEIVNGPDLDRRYWMLGMRGQDSGVGDIMLELTHASERLSFSGAYRPLAAGRTYSIAGYILAGTPRGTVVVEAPMPPVPFAEVQAARIEIRRIEKADYEDFLGRAVEKAEIVKAQSAPLLIPDAGGPDELASSSDPLQPKVKQPAPDEDKPKRDPPPMGGR